MQIIEIKIPKKAVIPLVRALNGSNKAEVMCQGYDDDSENFTALCLEDVADGELMSHWTHYRLWVTIDN